MHTIMTRRCIACRQTNLKQNLIRVCRVDGNYIIDNTYKALGRSAYICKNKACLTKVIDKKLLNRAFKTNLEDIYSNLRGCIE
ncbi:MAG: YlxR family protein [Clostridia bacterium]